VLISAQLTVLADIQLCDYNSAQKRSDTTGTEVNNDRGEVRRRIG
jgi:hypothetical protein